MAVRLRAAYHRLLCGADLNLVDPNVWDVGVPFAIAASLASLAVSWLVYDGLCRSSLRYSSSVLSSEAEVLRYARAVYLHAGISQAMPPANITLMEPGERAVIIGWYRSATAKGD